ncbi:MAG: MFS transporter, partial [Desulfobacteraceae bacterium]
DFLVDYYGVTKVQAEGAMSMLFVGGIPGSFFFGWFSDKIQRRKLPMLGAGIMAAGVLAFVIYGPRMPLSLLYALLIIQGFMCSAYVVSFALANDVRPPGSAGISVGFVNTCSVASSAVFQPGVGAILDSLGGNSPTPGDYRIALSAMVGLVVMAMLMALFSKETHCRPLYENTGTDTGAGQ